MSTDAQSFWLQPRGWKFFFFVFPELWINLLFETSVLNLLQQPEESKTAPLYKNTPETFPIITAIVCMWNCRQMCQNRSSLSTHSFLPAPGTQIAVTLHDELVPSSFSAWLWVGWQWIFFYEHISVAMVYVQKFQRNSCLAIRLLGLWIPILVGCR